MIPHLSPHRWGQIATCAVIAAGLLTWAGRLLLRVIAEWDATRRDNDNRANADE